MAGLGKSRPGKAGQGLVRLGGAGLGLDGAAQSAPFSCSESPRFLAANRR